MGLGLMRVLQGCIRVVFQIRVSFRVLVIRVPCYFGDLKRDPHLANYPYGLRLKT